MNDVVEQGNIDTSGCQVCHDEEVDSLGPKLEQPVFSCALVHGTENESALEACMRTELVNVLNMISCGSENNGLLFRVLEFNKFSHYIEKSSWLLA